MSTSSAFNDEKGGSSTVAEPEYGHDPASGGIFSSDYKRRRCEMMATSCCQIDDNTMFTVFSDMKKQKHEIQNRTFANPLKAVCCELVFPTWACCRGYTEALGLASP
ncbi:AP-3 complex subunit beta-2 isoform X5 [Tachysurus ichikawai]